MMILVVLSICDNEPYQPEPPGAVPTPLLFVQGTKGCFNGPRLRVAPVPVRCGAWGILRVVKARQGAKSPGASPLNGFWPKITISMGKSTINGPCSLANC